ncbi:nucleotide pyrophosphohydrolase [Candidatus Saccharibacteria bacterium]|nr:nucleotide pyrophosphohydrolase [Candidatus Saccharibacteria bacterium]HPD99334.1 nucleotide pyrophosphohydrolase [Candidatus Saccharibacteria bacterium]
MDYKTMQQRALQISNLYDMLNKKHAQKIWNEQDVMAGFVGDVGDLSKLIMAKNNLRSKDNVDEDLAHELIDCLCSLLVLADKLGIDLDQAFIKTMDSLEKKLTQKL